MTIKKLTHHLKDGLLIIFSVLFALFINKIAENHKTNENKEIAIESIHKELYRNSWVVKRWQKQHTATLERLDSLVNGKNDSLYFKLKNQDILNLGLITNGQSLIDAMILNSAWESAKETGINAEFDYQLLQMLTKAYDMQEMVTDKTLPSILNTIFDRNTHRMEELDLTLKLLLLHLQELVGNEHLLLSFYEESIKMIHQETHLKNKIYVDSLKSYVTN